MRNMAIKSAKTHETCTQTIAWPLFHLRCGRSASRARQNRQQKPSDLPDLVVVKRKLDKPPHPIKTEIVVALLRQFCAIFC